LFTFAKSSIHDWLRGAAGVALIIAVIVGIPAGIALVVLNGISACDAHRWNCGATRGITGLLLVCGPFALILATAVVKHLVGRGWPLLLGTIISLGGLWGYLVAVFVSY
jgi:hypothetical protein